MICAPAWRRQLIASLFVVASAFLFGHYDAANAADVRFVGTVGYAYVGSVATLTADRIQNNDAGGISGTLHLELWAFAAPYTGAAQIGYKLATYSLGQLNGGFGFPNVNSGPIPFAEPPNGTWIFTLFVTEFTGGSTNGGYDPRDYHNFSTPVVIGPPTLPPPTVTPQLGNWSNPSELGSGYTFDYKHGVLVVLFFSYQANGASKWYIASGPLTGNTFSGTLDKFIGGQCIFCTFRPPISAGNDGPVSIVFSSSTSATMYLPGGRVIPISPTVF
jgi:hypothetical protein